MKKIAFVIMPVVASALLSGCASHHQEMTLTTYEPVTTTTRTTRTVVVTETPPAPRVEVETAAPGPQHTWIQGYWMHVSDRWVWVPGHWEMRPREGATWVSGHWDKDITGKGWIWTAGHWE